MTHTTRVDTNEGSGINGFSPQRLKDLVLSGDGHVFDTKTGRSYRVNPSGQLALQLVQEGKPEKEVISQLAARYAQHVAVVAVGTEAFFSQLKRYLP
ncbi:MAG: PqqD family protein [Pseudomonadota bacterium]